MLVELWKLAAVAGLVEYSFSGLFTTPVSLSYRRRFHRAFHTFGNPFGWL
jgi:hypothetical protein